MILLAGQEVMQRQDRRLSGWWSFGLGTGCMMMSSVLVTAFALLTAIRPSPWYDPRYAIPLLGMILGNCMTGIALGLNTLTTSLMLRRASVEAQLMLGATRWDAAAPVKRNAPAAAAAAAVIPAPELDQGVTTPKEQPHRPWLVPGVGTL
jgi:putative ABC transport system permease protein